MHACHISSLVHSRPSSVLAIAASGSWLANRFTACGEVPHHGDKRDTQYHSYPYFLFALFCNCVHAAPCHIGRVLSCTTSADCQDAVHTLASTRSAGQGASEELFISFSSPSTSCSGQRSSSSSADPSIAHFRCEQRCSCPAQRRWRQPCALTLSD